MGESCDEWDKIEKPAFVLVNKKSSDEEDDEPVLGNDTINNNDNLVSDDSDSKEDEENLFGQEIKKEMDVAPRLL